MPSFVMVRLLKPEGDIYRTSPRERKMEITMFQVLAEQLIRTRRLRSAPDHSLLGFPMSQR
jgi:hypothetical protein